MWAVLTFWILLGLPGLALVQRFDRASLERGALSALTRAYFASFVLLTPFSVIGYLTRAPLLLLSAAAAISIVAGVVALALDRRWLALFARPGLAAAVCCSWLAFDLWLGARAGSHMTGDAGYHVARARLIFEFGFNNFDPLIGGEHFEPVYHTNLYHALIAACAQLTRVDVGVAWVWVWPLLKLLAAGGFYELAFAVFGARFCGYVAATTAGMCFATSSTLAFASSIGSNALLPFGIAAAVEATSESPRVRHAGWLGAASLVLAQTHLLYALFLALAVVPVLAARLGWALLTRERGRIALAAAIGAIALAGPWFYPPAQDRLEALWDAQRALIRLLVPPASAQDRAASTHVSERARARFVHFEDGLHVDPAPLFDSNTREAKGLIALVLVSACTRRRSAFALLAVLASTAAWLFTPALCTALVGVLGNWVVLRFNSVFFAASIAVTAAALPYVVARALSRPGIAHPRTLQALLELAAVLAALAYADRHGSYGAPWSKDETWTAALEFKAKEKAERIERRAKFFAAHVEPRAIVMAPLLRDYDIPMHCACRPFAFRRGRGERGQVGLDAHRHAVERFYARATPPEERLALLREYKVRFVFAGPARANWLARVFAPHVRGKAHDGDDAIVELKP